MLCCLSTRQNPAHTLASLTHFLCFGTDSLTLSPFLSHTTGITHTLASRIEYGGAHDLIFDTALGTILSHCLITPSILLASILNDVH